jgi:hypothetical protein
VLSQAEDRVQCRVLVAAVGLLQGSSKSIRSPMKLGREPVGSPAKIALVSRSMAVTVFCAAENVSRPMTTKSAPRRVSRLLAIRWWRRCWLRSVLPPPFHRRSMTSRPALRSSRAASAPP